MSFCTTLFFLLVAVIFDPMDTDELPPVLVELPPVVLVVTTVIGVFDLTVVELPPVFGEFPPIVLVVVTGVFGSLNCFWNSLRVGFLDVKTGFLASFTICGYASL